MKTVKQEYYLIMFPIIPKLTLKIHSKERNGLKTSKA